jgi:hypothetical protein
LSAFHKERRASDGLTSACKDCINSQHKETGSETRKRHHRARREYNLKRSLGLAPEVVSALVERSLHGVCEICGRPEAHKSKKALTVDHDHVTGKVRGLLCHKCNLVLGYAEDNPLVLQQAIVYLKGIRE